MNAIFVSGTNTGVGKTIICAAIGLALQARGIRVCYYKPFESGCKNLSGQNSNSDHQFVSSLLKLPGNPSYYNTYSFAPPLAPGVAAELEDIDISLEAVYKKFKELSNQFDYIIVEGAGGLLVPLTRFPIGQDTKKNQPPVFHVADLAKHLNLPILLVCSPALGTINHTLLTVEVCKTRGLNIQGIIMNEHVEVDKLTKNTNKSVFRKYFKKTYLGHFPKLPLQPNNPPNDTTRKQLQNAAKEFLDIQTLLTKQS